MRTSMSPCTSHRFDMLHLKHQQTTTESAIATTYPHPLYNKSFSLSLSLSLFWCTYLSVLSCCGVSELSTADRERERESTMHNASMHSASQLHSAATSDVVKRHQFNTNVGALRWFTSSPLSDAKMHIYKCLCTRVSSPRFHIAKIGVAQPCRCVGRKKEKLHNGSWGHQGVLVLHIPLHLQGKKFKGQGQRRSVQDSSDE
ncbi:hypothetical protein TRVL_05224 [Trypanosoma vivax]|nr:hypothetical protein TRVL_05224 [Trypanosoma vivax]